MSLGKKVFTQKTYGAQLYKWSPPSNDIAKSNNNSKKPYFCNATPFSQGQDWITTYAYDLIVVNSQQEKIAYVECGYVE